MNKIESFRGPYRFLSNFFSCPVLFEGIIYSSSEHAYQASKTLDIQIRKSFTTISAGQAKRKGQLIALQPNWEQLKIPTMEHILRCKFSHQQLAGMLIATKGKYLEEGNTWNDTFWGVCNGIGRNELGNALMKIRGELITASPPMESSHSLLD